MTIVGTSVIGVSHLNSGLPCQDACKYKVTANGKAIVAVADGVGSAPKSDIGARFIVNEVLEHLEQIDLKKQRIEEGDIKEVIMFAREKLKKMAEDTQEDFQNLATTLIVVVAYETDDKQKEVMIAHIGDGAVLAESDKLEILSLPEESESKYKVAPITVKNWYDYMHFYKFKKNFKFIAIITDGCQPVALKKENNGISVPLEEFFRPIFYCLKNNKNPEECTDEIRKLLSSQKVNEYTWDDKTLVVITF
ncbi:MAG: protein phosphatase 2C domain-containing protein [Candidatus Calescibacterium sp.]|nr:protein phosphatase 2C domain-containing protein [Candidatus Calescibacterium sp.]MCX7734154.1 protein phosphatase 2C domain-containing protein [bacterium]